MPTAPYGSWKSPITADAIVAGSIALYQPQIAGDTLYWLEGRPTEGGRNVIVRRHPDGRTEDVIPPPFNARTRVHEYGGADYLVAPSASGEPTLYFANFADQRLYTLSPGSDPIPLTHLPTYDPNRSSSPSPPAGRGPGGGVPSLTRYADLTLDRARNRLIAVRETHFDATGDPPDAHIEPTNDIAAIDLDAGAETTLAAGHDFYAYPRLSHDGAHLAWIAWDHPNMPWDATQLYLAPILPSGILDTPRLIAGGPRESVLQPTWSPDGALYFLSDRTGYWNLYRLDVSNLPVAAKLTAPDTTSSPGAPAAAPDAPFGASPSPRKERGPGGEVGAASTHLTASEPHNPNPLTLEGEGRGEGDLHSITPIAPQPYDFAQPLWQLGTTTYAFDAASNPLSAGGEGAGGGIILATYARDGMWRLARIEPATGALTDLDIPVTSVRELIVENGRAYFIAGYPDRPTALVSLDVATGTLETIKSASTLNLDPGYISIPQPIEYPTDTPPGYPEAGAPYTAHALYYPPRNQDYEDPEAPVPNPLSAGGEGAGGGVTPELPPLLVMSHGGPTAATAATLSPRIQYWTSRGIAVLDVNYGGSTGYGRPYRERLNRNWGIVDVLDCINGARHLVAQGLADPSRLAITGGSAGGYTTLAALTFHDVFKAGASHYGIGDLEALATDTHKFESRYLDNLIGPYPDARNVYVERSPIHHTDKLHTPVAFFQGLEDRIVPPNQAETMVDALRRKGVPVAYFPFEGEQHGFRRAENIKRSLEAELLFYGRIFGFTPADNIEPFEIENLPR